MRITAAEYKAMVKNGKPTVKWGKTGPTESQQQAACVEWFRTDYPELAMLLFSVPNGGKRSKREAAQLVREGATSGIPDLVLAVPKQGYHGLFVEQKKKGNTTTPNQKAAIAALSEQGYRCEVVFSTEQFKEVIRKYLAE